MKSRTLSPEELTPSVIPRPWFRAHNLNSPICQMFERPYARRELASDERQLGSFVLPPFQRPPVWRRAQQIRLIESIWGGLPIGAYVYNQILTPNHPCDGWLLDGQQRVTAILAYVAGKFPVYGWRYPDLPIVDRRGFEMTPTPAMQTNITTREECLEVYARLAYGGTAHRRRKSTEG